MVYTQDNKSLTYARDDVFIISINNSTDNIELLESELFINPNNLFSIYGRISALYSKTHTYLKDEEKILKELMNIRTGLYNPVFLKDLKENKIKPETSKHFIRLVDGLISLYREMTRDFTIGIFPKFELEDKRPGAVKTKN